MSKNDELIEINNYWLQEFPYLEIDYPTCFVCGKDKYLEKCHIIPKEKGGSATPDNLVLLCRSCHSKAPNTVIPRIMLDWIHKEVEKYDLVSHIKKDTFIEILGYGTHIYERLIPLSKNTDLIDEFIRMKLNEDISIFSCFNEANTNTIAKYYKYLSECDTLELDYLQYLVKEYEEV